MALTLAALASEIQNDPMGLGYAPLVAEGADQAVADVLNAPNRGTITLTAIDNADFTVALLPLLPAIAALADSNKQQMYWQVWQAILSLPAVDLASSNVQAVFAQAVTDGLLTSAQVAALQQRPGSRAEMLFGAGSVVTHTQVAAALGRGNP